MAIDNITTTDINFLATQGSLLKDSLPLGSITISPNQGFQISHTDFSLNTPIPSYIDLVANPPSFQQSGDNVIFTFRFTDSANMPNPGESIEIPICMNGIATAITFTLNGEVNIIGDANTSPTGTRNSTYTVSNSLGNSSQAWQVTASSANGFYFPSVPSIVSSTETDEAPYTITTVETYDSTHTTELKSVQYTAMYNFQAGGRYNLATPSYDTFNIYSNIAIPSSNGATGITSYIMDTSAVGQNGTTRSITVYGSSGTVFSIQLSNDGGTNYTYVSQDVVMPSSQSLSADIVFAALGTGDASKTYKIKITDSNGNTINLTQSNPITILQPANVEALFKVSYGGTTVSAPALSFTPSSTPSSAQTMYARIVLNGTTARPLLTVNQIPTTEWNNQNGTELNGTDFTVKSVTVLPVNTESSAVALTLEIEFEEFGSAGFTSIAQIDSYVSNPIPPAPDPLLAIGSSVPNAGEGTLNFYNGQPNEVLTLYFDGTNTIPSPANIIFSAPVSVSVLTSSQQTRTGSVTLDSNGAASSNYDIANGNLSVTVSVTGRSSSVSLPTGLNTTINNT